MRLLVCDQLAVVRHGLSALLVEDDNIESVAMADSGADALVLARRQRPDVIVIGFRLKDMSGLELVRQLNDKKIELQPRIIVLSILDQLDNDDTLQEILREGVSGLLAEDVTGKELRSAVRIAARGEIALNPQVADRLVRWFRTQVPEAAPPRAGSDIDALTEREREVLCLLASGLSAEEAAAKLLIGTTTVRTHLYRLRTKLGLSDCAQLVAFAFQRGLAQGIPQMPPWPPASSRRANGWAGEAKHASVQAN